jgi:CheY-like chemotaxis protein
MEKHPHGMDHDVLIESLRSSKKLTSAYIILCLSGTEEKEEIAQIIELGYDNLLDRPMHSIDVCNILHDAIVQMKKNTAGTW